MIVYFVGRFRGIDSPSLTVVVFPTKNSRYANPPNIAVNNSNQAQDRLRKQNVERIN